MSPDRPTSTTRRTLLGFLAALLVGIVATLGGCLAVFVGVHRSTAAAHDRSVPAVLAVYDAQLALRQAHGAALAGFSGGTRLLADPGEDYRNQIARAGQQLAQAAEDNAAGEDGSRDIQVVEASVVTYTGLVERAHAYFAQDGGNARGTATLWDASILLEEILRRLDRLGAKQIDALDGQADGLWTSGAMTLLWLVPVLALLALLVAAQRFLRRRFRRRLNVPLLLATLAVVVMGATAAMSLWSGHQLADARAETGQAAHDREAQLATLSARDSDRLSALLTAACGSPGCPETIARVRQDASPAPAPSAGSAATTPAPQVTEAGARHGEDAARSAERAADSRAGEVVLLAAALFALAMVALGLLPRLEEYRFRQR
ncbi:hypothetical protein C5N14_10155 [Micromonospora sp. MW-13]|uniref:hypothetical protein n=1 Tax=unclassified Micromonospora TaxID=2617518 RepID=UPI000E4349E5|nr:MULTISPECIES: hypothetical protein [unclassified Micromonospora]MCX4472925.1 hypothetical protein [Micromonospora sp. NBC_01655]RGC69118.1 hypothetical protein C5N14_10155 [Micromonospora sp. MW-13]